MKRTRIELVARLLLAAAMSLPVAAAPQTRPISPPPEPAPARGSEPIVELPVEPASVGRAVLRIGQDYTLSAGDAIRELTVISGTATIEGRVESDVVVVFGKAQLSSTASIDGSLVVVGGSASVAPGGRVRRDLVIVGGDLDAPAGFSPGGEHVVVGPRTFGGRIEAIVPWITRGLFWGRPIVPSLPWVWGIVGFFFLVYLALNLVFDAPVRACVQTLAEKPLTAFLVGLLVLLLTGPVCLLLTVSVIGVAVVPLVLCALFIGWIVGKVGVARWIGLSVAGQGSRNSQWESLRSFAIGFAVITAAYVVPVLGFAAWTMVGVFGLGAAALAFIGGYRRENPLPVPRVPSVATAPPTPYEERGGALPTPDRAAETFSPSAAPVQSMVTPDLASFPHALFRDRLAAFVLDVILVLIAAQLLYPIRRGNDSTIFLLLLAYHIGFWTWKGTTVGGIICQLRVVRVDGTPLRFVDALVRGLSSIFSLAVLGLGCLWILKDPDRQSWHDKIAGTYVVKVPRNWPL